MARKTPKTKKAWWLEEFKYSEEAELKLRRVIARSVVKSKNLNSPEVTEMFESIRKVLSGTVSARDFSPLDIARFDITYNKLESAHRKFADALSKISSDDLDVLRLHYQSEYAKNRHSTNYMKLGFQESWCAEGGIANAFEHAVLVTETVMDALRPRLSIPVGTRPQNEFIHSCFSRIFQIYLDHKKINFGRAHSELRSGGVLENLVVAAIEPTISHPSASLKLTVRHIIQKLKKELPNIAPKISEIL